MKDLEERRVMVEQTIIKIIALSIKAESYEEIDDLKNLLTKTKNATTQDQLTDILKEAMVYTVMAKQNYIDRQNNEEN